MKKKATRLIVIAAITGVLAGCGGGGLGALLGLISIGNAVGEIEDLFGGDTADRADVLLDGQVIRTVDRGNNTIRLQGLPEGRHLLQIVSSDFRGILRLINVNPGEDVQLGQLQAEDGGLISGTVMLREADDSTRPAVRVAVYAVPRAQVNLSPGGAATTLPPLQTHYVAYTDGNGRYEFNAVTPGDYLVTATVAGYTANVQLIQGLQVEQRQRNKNLELVADDVPAGSAAGVVLGNTNGGSSSLGGASLRASLGSAYVPAIPQDTANRISRQDGGTVRSSSWFRWEVLSTLADSGGSYSLPLPPGTPRIDAFSYGFRPAFRDPTIVADVRTPVDFTLEQR